MTKKNTKKHDLMTKKANYCYFYNVCKAYRYCLSYLSSYLSYLSSYLSYLSSYLSYLSSYLSYLSSYSYRCMGSILVLPYINGISNIMTN